MFDDPIIFLAQTRKPAMIWTPPHRHYLSNAEPERKIELLGNNGCLAGYIHLVHVIKAEPALPFFKLNDPLHRGHRFVKRLDQSGLATPIRPKDSNYLPIIDSNSHPLKDYFLLHRNN